MQVRAVGNVFQYDLVIMKRNISGIILLFNVYARGVVKYFGKNYAIT